MALNAYKLNEVHACIDGKYVPARPYLWNGCLLNWREAWLVLIGKRHTVVFPGQEP